MQHTPGLIRTPRDTLVELIEIAYDVQKAQIRGAPEWAKSVRYDISFAAPESTFAGPYHGEEQARQMLQMLLADRFKLAVHRESGDMTVAALVVAPGGVAMNQSDHRAGDWQGIELVPGRLVGQAAPMTRLARIIALSTGQTVLDSTGLRGTYDFDAHWNAESATLSSHRWEYEGTASPVTQQPGPVLPSFEAALRQQLGLVLEPGKNRQVQLIVVDRVEQPLIVD